MAQHASGQLRVNADVEIVRIEPASEADVEPRVVVRLARVIPDGMGDLVGALMQSDSGTVTSLRVGDSYRVKIELALPADASGEAA